jgi:hypothetical protein
MSVTKRNLNAHVTSVHFQNNGIHGRWKSVAAAGDMKPGDLHARREVIDRHAGSSS